jgi:hypothetical protein
MRAFFIFTEWGIGGALPEKNWATSSSILVLKACKITPLQRYFIFRCPVSAPLNNKYP